MTGAHTTGDLLEKTARGGGWVIGWRLTTRLLGLLNTIVLVRLLLPGDFGLVALGATFAQALEALGMAGLEDNLVREQHPTRALYDTAFTLNLLRALVTAVIVAALAAPAAAFFAEPRLRPVIMALAIVLGLDGLDNIGVVDFRRDFAFRKDFVLWVVPRIVSVVCSIAAALLLRSYVALLIGILTNRVLRVILGYVLHPYRPRLQLGAWRHLVGYSAWAWVLSLVSIVRDKTATILIGRMLGATPVGLFSLGFELASLPTTELVEPLMRSAFSGFSATRHQRLDGGQTYLRLAAAMAMITIPSGIGIALVANPMVRLAFGPLWVGAVPVVQCLGLGGALTVFGALSAGLFRVYGEMRLIFRVSLLVEAVRVALLVLLTWQYGLRGAAAATAVAFAIEQLYFLRLTQARFGISTRALLARLWRTVSATVCMAALLLLSGLCAPLTAGASGGALALQATTAALAGAATYTGTALLLWLLCGRPAGAEADLLALARRVLRPLLARWMPA